AYTSSANNNMSLPIKKMKGRNFNTTTRVSLNRDPSLLNNIMNFTHNLTIGEDLRLNYYYKEKLDMGITASIDYTYAHYNNTSLTPNQSYFTHSYTADLTYTFPHGFILATDFDYTFNTGRTDGFNRNYAIWNG